jgi:hypothetical protein
MNPFKRFLVSNKTLIIIFLLGLTPLLWFKKDLLIAGGDDFELLNPAAFTKYFLYVWNVKLLNAGGAILSVPRLIPELLLWSGLRSIDVSNLLIERFWAVCLFLLPGVTLYILMSTIYNKTWAKLVAATLYMFNLFVMVVGPFQANTKLVLIALPLQLLFWMRGLNEGKQILKYPLLIGFCSLIYSGSNVNPPAVAVIPITLVVYLLLFFVAHPRNLIFIIRFVLTTVICYVLFNLWWLVNFIVNIVPVSGGVKSAATFSAISSGMMSDFFRLLGSWGWRSGHYQMPYFPYAHHYEEPLLLILSFLIPMLAFLAVYFRPKDRIVIFFTVLSVVGIFLAKGSLPPFGFVYRWVWEHVPGFWIFREPFAKFTPITLFSYSVLLGISTQALYERFCGVPALERIPRFLVSNSVPFLVLLAILTVSFPMFNGDVIWHYWNGSMRSFHSQVPAFWQELRGWLDKNDPNARVFLSPKGGYGAAYNWVNGISSADSPALVLLDNPILRLSPLVTPADRVVSNTYDYLDNGDSVKLVNSLRLLNAKYILQENDLDWRYMGKILTPTQANNFLGLNFPKVAAFGMYNQGYLDQVANGDFDAQISSSLSKELLNKNALVLYKLKEADYLPKFYVAQREDYLNNSQDKISDLLSFTDFPERPAIYTADSAAEGSAQRKDLLSRSSYIFVKPEEIKVMEKTTSVTGMSTELMMPNVSLLPNSPIYFLVGWKEWFLLNREHDDTTYIDKLLWFSSKRISEMVKLESLGRPDLVVDVFKRYVTQLTDLEGRLERLSRSKTNPFSVLKKCDSYFSQHRDILVKLEGRVYDRGFADYFNKSNDLYRRASLLLSSKDSLLYTFNIPESGRYSIMIKDEQIGEYSGGDPYGRIAFTFNQLKPQQLTGLRNTQGRYEYQPLDFSAGLHRLSIPSFITNNSIKNGSFEDNFDFGDASSFQPSLESIDGSRSLKITANIREEKKAFWPVNNFRSNTSYSISFYYKSLIGSPIRFYVWEDRKEAGDSNEPAPSLEVKLDPGPSWQRFETVFTPKIDSREAEVEFMLLGNGGRSVALLDNLTVNGIISPSILLKKKRPDDVYGTESRPKITFIRENPTQYKLLVERANAPYTLIFSESFSREWKAFVNIKTPLRSEYSKPAASYLNGDIMEVPHTESFFGGGIFNTLGLTAIPDSHHNVVNGYANSWYITPADASGKESYEIIIEYTPQKIFYVTILISLVSGVIGLAYLVLFFKKTVL